MRLTFNLDRIGIQCLPLVSDGMSVIINTIKFPRAEVFVDNSILGRTRTFRGVGGLARTVD